MARKTLLAELITLSDGREAIVSLTEFTPEPQDKCFAWPFRVEIQTDGNPFRSFTDSHGTADRWRAHELFFSWRRGYDFTNK